MMASRDYFVGNVLNLTANGTPSSEVYGDIQQTELGRQTRTCTDNLASLFYTAANEPSLALFRVQEHVRKSVPSFVQQKVQSEEIKSNLKGAIYDLDYSVDAIKTATASLLTFKSINENLKKSIHFAHQIVHTQKPSMYNQSK